MRIFRKALYLSLCSWYDNKGKMTRRADGAECTNTAGGSEMKEFMPKSAAIRDYMLDSFNLDYISNGRQLLYLYKATGDKKYLRAASAAIRAGGEPRK